MPADKITIDNGVIDCMLNDNRFLRDFPFLRTAKRKVVQGNQGCGGCGGGRRTPRVKQKPNYGLLKRQLAGMAKHKKVRLKSLLQAKQVRVKYQDVDGTEKVVKWH
jgi:hypothetical protein